MIVQNYLFSPLELTEHPLEAFVHVIELEKKQSNITDFSRPGTFGGALELYPQPATFPDLPSPLGLRTPCGAQTRAWRLSCPLAPPSGDCEMSRV